MTTISIKLSKKAAAQLAAAAKAERKTPAHFARAAVQEKLRANLPSKFLKADGTPMSFYEATKDLCGIGDSGVTDLATNRKYMEGFGE